MAKLTSGLKTFGIQPSATTSTPTQAEQPEPAQPQSKQRSARGQADVVYVGVRLKRKDWNRVHEQARSRGKSLQQLIEEGLSRLLQDEGLAPISRWYEE